MHFFNLALDAGRDLYFALDVKERHGFNKLTARLYVRDKLLMTLLWATVGAFVFYLFMGIIEYGGPFFGLYLLGFSLLLIVLNSFVFQPFISPLFNKHQELTSYEHDNLNRTKREKLVQSLTELTTNLGCRDIRILVVDSSKRTGHSNASFNGLSQP